MLMPVQDQPILSIDGAKATIVLSRPHHHNRIDPDDIPVINRHLDVVEHDDAIRLLVITGTGEKTFSSGYTLSAILTRMDDSFQRLLGRIERLGKPTLCALNGSAYGGGVDLATCCDFRVGVHGSRMFIPAARFGLHYFPDGIRRFTQRVGPTAAKKIFMLGMDMQAQEMLRVGFLSDLVDRDELPATVERYLRALHECDGGVVASMKRNIDTFAAGELEPAAWIEKYYDCLRSPEMAARVGAL